MIKIYASKAEEYRLMGVLAEFKCRVYLNYPVKGRTRKVRGVKLFKVVDAPI